MGLGIVFLWVWASYLSGCGRDCDQWAWLWTWSECRFDRVQCVSIQRGQDEGKVQLMRDGFFIEFKVVALFQKG